MKNYKAIVIGAGSRGRGYSDIMKKLDDGRFTIVGVAEPLKDRRNYIKDYHNLEDKNCFNDWREILSVPKFADVAIIATMDRDHAEPAIKAMEMGYDLLLEKPAAPTAKDCMDIYRAAKKYGRKVMVCHVLRYTDFYKKLKATIQSGVIGEVVSVNHIEAVEPRHQSHSFVRGNWGNSERSSTMLLQKSCHDIDILQWLLEKDCEQVQSFGALKYFTPENAPEGAPERCTDGCPHAEDCYYNAIKLYYDNKKHDWFRRSSTKLPDPTDEDVMNALKTTQYGKCVYKCDNDVVDRQSVNMMFEDGIVCNFTMSAFCEEGRVTRIMGTKGSINASMKTGEVKVKLFGQDEYEVEDDSELIGDTIVSGHGGGDTGIILALYDYLEGNISADEVSEIGISCKNHLIVFAAEESRLNNTVVNFKDFMKKYLF